jgi:ABC-2 type transport system ATP-binding protein
MGSAITTSGLGKTFITRTGPVEAVRDLTFEVGKNEVIGPLGPNGAGKTTTMRMLSTLEQPTAGTATIAGHDLRHDPRGVRQSIGLVAQSGGSRPTATVRDELLLQARLHRLSDPMAQAETMMKAFELTELAARPTMTLSGGQRRRLDLAIGLIHAPQVIFLDEPTAALDPPSRNELWGHIRALRARADVTVVLSTHHLDEADALCDRVLILDHGKLIAEDSPARLKQRLGNDVITIDAGLRDDQVATRTLASIADLPHVRDVRRTGNELRIGCENAEGLLTRVVLTLHDAGIDMHGLQVAHPSLDDVFLALTGHTTAQER